MEFRFRSSEDRDAFFSASHALPGMSVELGREPMMEREALQPEPQTGLQTEQIKEEPIEREIARRRMLEEEARRVMELERELAVRRQLLQAEIGLSRERLMTDALPMPLVSEPREVQEKLPLPLQLPLPLPLPLHAKPLRIIEASPQPDQPQPKKETPPVPEGNMISLSLPVTSTASLTTFINPSNLNLTGTKRKTPPVTSEWGCVLCHVSSTSKEALDEHIQGKKHKTKEAQLGIHKTEADSEGASSSTAEQAQIPLLENGVPARDPAQEGKENKDSQDIWCELCSVKCNSEMVMTFHLQGKKHKAQLRASNKKVPQLKGSSKKAPRARAFTASSIEKVKEIVDQATEKKKREDPPKIEVDPVPAEKEKKEDREQVDDMNQNTKREAEREEKSSKANGMELPSSDAAEETNYFEFFSDCQYDAVL